jgi:PTS system nitrogen regulatory IIA component
MNPIINQLIQLQDLNFTLVEQEALLSKRNLSELKDAIKSLAKNLPPDVLNLFEKLRIHYATAVVPMANDICSGCGISIPTRLAYEIKVGETFFQCPRCTRILYYHAIMPRQLKRVSSRTIKPIVGVARFSSSSLMLPNLTVKTPEGVLSELINLMANEGFIEHPQSLLTTALNREAIVSTAVEHGLAFPHVRGVEGGGLIFAVGLKKQGFKFGAPKNRLTKIIFFLVIPLAASAFYLQLISGLIETFRETKPREKLLACKTPEAMWKTLCSLTKKTIQ